MTDPHVRVDERDLKALADTLHYPEHWDTVNYPTLGAALIEVLAWHQHTCSECWQK